MTKTTFIFIALSLKFLDFAVELCFRSKFSREAIQVKLDSGVIWLDQSHSLVPAKEKQPRRLHHFV